MGLGMEALARALLLPLLAQGLLRAAPAPGPAPFLLSLQVATATNRRDVPTPGPGTLAAPRADGLALALEPAGSPVNFLAMVDNLQGDSGRGYYLEMQLGTPPQKVRCPPPDTHTRAFIRLLWERGLSPKLGFCRVDGEVEERRHRGACRGEGWSKRLENLIGVP